MSAGRWRDRVDAVDWDDVRSGLDEVGCALTGPLLSPDEAAEIAALYPDDTRFRSTIDMGRYRFGAGDWDALHRDLYGEMVLTSGSTVTGSER